MEIENTQLLSGNFSFISKAKDDSVRVSITFLQTCFNVQTITEYIYQLSFLHSIWASY